MAECVPYKRHLPPCEETSRSYTRCACPCYAQGNIVRETGVIEYINRKSLHTTDMTLARKIVRTWHNNHTSTPIARATVLTLEAAVTDFLEDFSRETSDQTKDQYALLLLRRLVPFCGSRAINITTLTDVTHKTLNAFIATWPNAQLTNALNRGRLKKFFNWCEQRNYITALTNPIKLTQPITRKHIQKQPFSSVEMERIYAACVDCGTIGPASPEMLIALVLLIRWCGPRLGDAIVMRWSNFTSDGWLDYTAQKNGKQVTIPVHPDVLRALKAIKRDGSDFIFHRSHRSPFTAKGKTRPSVKSRWSEALRELFILAGVEDGGSHRFRHTCAVEALTEGTPSEVVAQMLGDDVATVIHSYSAQTKERVKRAGQFIAKQWQA